MADNWIPIFESFFMHEIQIAQSILDQHDIPNVVVNKTDSIYPVNGQIELYVMQDDALKARHYLQTEMR